jgi:glycine amidinotransferase
MSPSASAVETPRFRPNPGVQTVVSSFNEWDPLEEVVVGTLDGATIPSWDVALKATMPHPAWPAFHQRGGRPFPADWIEPAKRELEEFVHILEAEGVTVRRPEPYNHSRAYATQDWFSAGGLYSAMPRDAFLVVGDEIIEAPMAWRSRYFEANAYRSLLKEYFRQGARWTSVPKPELKDELFELDFEEPTPEDPPRFVITEFEPTFDAADFARCGRDIFAQRSNVTNLFGIEWLRRHLGAEYRVHLLEVDDPHPMHVDATFVPLAPGKLMINPERVSKIPEVLRHWDVLVAPEPVERTPSRFSMCTEWISMNVFSLDEERVFVEKTEEPLVRQLKDWGFQPILCSLKNFNIFGGGFHCCTLDVRRRGTLRSYT